MIARGKLLTPFFIVWAACYYPSSSVVAVVAGSSSSSTVAKPKNQINKLVIGVDGGTESIRACCFDAATGRVVGKACAVAYPTRHPQPGWAEQDPADWYASLGEAVRGAVSSISDRERDSNNSDDDEEGEENEICGICIDTTCCSVVALDARHNPLRPCLLWMDQRSASQTRQILETCQGDPALSVNCNGQGPLSAEWMIGKALWICQNEPDIWKKANTICEYQDYINWKLTGVMCASSCNAATRWHWNGEECIQQPDGASNKYPGRPLSLYSKLGIPELADKLPRKCLPMGALVGRLTKEAAQHLALPKGLAVIQGGPDAFVGMIGLGCIQAGQVCLITGSSHLHCVVVSPEATRAPGTWGPYRGAPLPGLQFAEGGQSSTGSLLRWARQNLFGGGAAAAADSLISYQELDQEATAIPPGSDGLVVLETFQGSRTPVTDPLARGAILGLTLSHTRAHLWRALMEGVCFGTRACLEGLSNTANTEQQGNNHDNTNDIILAGGIARSPLWLQMHADVTGRPVVVCENADAPLLGCAILASVGVGLHKTVPEAVAAMVRAQVRIEPDKDAAKVYSQLYKEVYSQVADAVRPVSHALHRWRGGGQERSLKGSAATLDEESQPHGSLASVRANNNGCVVSPSLLSADWSDMKAEVQRCIDAGATRLHVDIFDGVFLDSPHALTFGPKMVESIRRSCSTCTNAEQGGTAPAVYLDLHVCVVSPERYVDAMAETGADCFIFQWEAMALSSTTDTGLVNDNERLLASTQLARSIIEAGMECGVSINPETNVQDILPLLETGLVSVVDILAVEPGFGGQAFQPVALEKARFLNTWLNEHDRESDHARRIDIMVDGGVNGETASEIRSAGANVLVSGSFLFGHPSGMRRGIEALLSSPST